MKVKVSHLFFGVALICLNCGVYAEIIGESVHVGYFGFGLIVSIIFGTLFEWLGQFE